MTGAEAQLRLLRAAQARLQELEAKEEASAEPVAIIGIGCRFPGGADAPELFWQLLVEGRDATRDAPEDRWPVNRLYDPAPGTPGKMYVRRGGFLDDIRGFEPEVFGLSAREAEAMDPQQRLLLEVAWEALENAWIRPESLAGSATGVFAGLCFDDYARRSAASGDVGRIDPFSALGTSRSVAVGRIAYVFGLQGPVIQIDTSCSSSLVALHLAAGSLRSRECDLALAGGVNLITGPESSIAFSALRALSADGRSRAFSASAAGYGRGEGCGLVVLRRLSDAISAGDAIWAVIQGSALNHDGRSNGLTAPNGQSQEQVIRAALARAGLSSRAVGFVEAHGTGTPLGDPIEVRALARVYGEGRLSGGPLLIGSVKSNFGHLEGAAGIAGVIKAALALHHGIVPASLHAEVPNAHVNWSSIPVVVATRATAWPGQIPHHAGVSSFGMSGTNAHVILSSAPETPVRPTTSSPFLLTLTGHTADALARLSDRFRDILATAEECDVPQILSSANTGRARMRYRYDVTAATRQELVGALAPERVRAGATVSTPLVYDGEPARWAAGARGIPVPTFPFERRPFWQEWPPGSPFGADDEASSLVVLTAHDDRPVRDAILPFVRHCVAGALAVADLDVPPETPIQDLGVDSLAVTDVHGAILAAYGADLPFQDLLERSCAGISQLLETQLDGSSQPDPDPVFLSDAVLASDILPGRARAGDPKPGEGMVLLTGATGFLGAYLLDELGAQTDAEIACLVRAGTDAEGVARIRANVERFGLDWERVAARVRPVPGDLALPAFGLSDRAYAALADEVGVIVSNGAEVSYIAPYRTLRPSHVVGTQELLRLASSGRRKSFHHISSIAAFEASRYRGLTRAEFDAPSDGEGIHIGYSQCKWVSKALVREAARRGVPVRIYRPSLIAGDSRSGSWNANDFLNRVFQTFPRLRVVPSDLDIALDCSPVDFVARAVVHLARTVIGPYSAFHLAHEAPITLRELTVLFAEHGVVLEAISYAAWLERVAMDPGCAVHPLLPFLRHRWNGENKTYIEMLQQDLRCRLSNVATMDMLRKAGIACPPLDARLIGLYLAGC